MPQRSLGLRSAQGKHDPTQIVIVEQRATPRTALPLMRADDNDVARNVDGRNRTVIHQNPTTFTLTQPSAIDIDDSSTFQPCFIKINDTCGQFASKQTMSVAD